MPVPEQMPDWLVAKLRLLTTAVPQSELEKFIYYDHIPILKDASHSLGLFVMVRRTNEESIKFVGYPGFVPKPLACKPKTAKTDAQITLPGGERVLSRCAGLVVNPKMAGASAFGPGDEDFKKAIATWDKYWGKGVPEGFVIQTDPNSGYYACVMRCGKGTQVFPHSRTSSGHQEAESIRTETVSQPGATGFQLLPNKNIDRNALSTLPTGCSYIHGDYDLYALIHVDSLKERVPKGGLFDGVAHTYGANWKRFEAFVRPKINLDMIQHGSQEHFDNHTEDAVDIFCPAVERELWHVMVNGKDQLDKLYKEAFQGREPGQH